MLSIAIKFAKENGYDTAVKCGKKFKGRSVFCAEDRGSEFACTGYPAFIIIDDNEARFADFKEIDEIMGFHTPPKGYVENLL